MHSTVHIYVFKQRFRSSISFQVLVPALTEPSPELQGKHWIFWRSLRIFGAPPTIRDIGHCICQLRTDSFGAELDNDATAGSFPAATSPPFTLSDCRLYLLLDDPILLIVFQRRFNLRLFWLVLVFRIHGWLLSWSCCWLQSRQRRHGVIRPLHHRNRLVRTTVCSQTIPNLPQYSLEKDHLKQILFRNVRISRQVEPKLIHKLQWWNGRLFDIESSLAVRFCDYIMLGIFL